MIPYIIGGVALAATGYGVAKLFEDRCSSRSYKAKKEEEKEHTQESSVEPREKAHNPRQEDSLVGEYKKVLSGFYDRTIWELYSIYNELENFKDRVIGRIPLNESKGSDSFTEHTVETKESISWLIKNIKNSKAHIDRKLPELKEIFQIKKDYETYTKEEINLAVELQTILNLINDTTHIKLTQDGKTVNQEMLDIHRELEKMTSSSTY